MDFVVENYSPPFNVTDFFAPFRSSSIFPLSFYEERCVRCGSSMVKFGNRRNTIKEHAKKYSCPNCRVVRTPGFNRYAHLPVWAYDRVLFSMSKNYRNVDILDEVKKKSRDLNQDVKISTPTIYNIGKKCLTLLYKFEPIALQALSTKRLDGNWCMDDRFHDLPFDQKLFSGGKLDKSKGHPHMHLTVATHEEAGYAFSGCVSKKRDRFVAMRTLATAIGRAGVEPQKLKIDMAKGLYKAARTLLPSGKILRINKKQDFSFNNAIERWFSHFGARFRKHECRFKRPKTLEDGANIYRYYRNFLKPYRRHQKTPAELLGLVLPRKIKDELSFIPLLDFADRLINYVNSEVAARKKRVPSTFRGFLN